MLFQAVKQNLMNGNVPRCIIVAWVQLELAKTKSIVVTKFLALLCSDYLILMDNFFKVCELERFFVGHVSYMYSVVKNSCPNIIES